MRKKNLVRLGVGMAFWAGAFSLLAVAFASTRVEEYQPAQQLSDWIYDRHFEVQLHYDWLPDWPRPKKGDAVRYSWVVNEEAVKRGEPRLIEVLPIGEVASVRELPGGGADLRLQIFPHARQKMRLDTTFLAYTGPENFEEVLEVLIDDSTRANMEDEWQDFLNRHQMDLEGLFKPLIEDALQDYIAVITPDVEAAIDSHTEDLNAIFATYWDGSVKGTLLPLVEQKGMPQVEERIMPIVRECGQALWEIAPAGSFAWNAFRDKIVPWDSKTNLQERFDGWLKEEKTQNVINEYVPKMKAEAEAIGVDLANDPDIGQVTKQMLRDILTDPRLGQLLQQVIQEAIVDNPKTTEFLRARWLETDVQSALRQVGRMIEPFANGAIDSILLDRKERRINPNLVTVMRSQILWKGDFWILAGPGNEEDVAAANGTLNLVSDGYRYPAGNTRVGYTSR